MRALVYGLAAALAAAGTVLAAQALERKPSVYTDGLYGFSIQAPAFPKAGKGSNVVPAILLGPAHGGFSSNVNVMIQHVVTTRDAYRQLSLGQMKAAGFKVLSDRDETVSGKEAIRCDYEGSQAGRDLRFLVLAVMDGDRVFLVTCTALKDEFGDYQKEFEACLGSFKLISQP